MRALLVTSAQGWACFVSHAEGNLRIACLGRGLLGHTMLLALGWRPFSHVCLKTAECCVYGGACLPRGAMFEPLRALLVTRTDRLSTTNSGAAQL